MVYLDDILVYSATFEEHLQRLKRVFQRLREAKMKLKPKKCEFCLPSIRYLGHVINVDLQKLLAVN